MKEQYWNITIKFSEIFTLEMGARVDAALWKLSISWAFRLFGFVVPFRWPNPEGEQWSAKAWRNEVLSSSNNERRAVLIFNW